MSRSAPPPAVRRAQDLANSERVAVRLGERPGGPPAAARGRKAATAGLPRCPEHLNKPAAKEWRRVAALLHGMGVLTAIDRAALAAYCQAWGRWVEAEEKLRETPALIRTGSGNVQQSPWLGIAHRQLELMGRYMVELGMTPASRSRVTVQPRPVPEQTRADETGAWERLVAKLDAMARRMAAGGTE